MCMVVPQGHDMLTEHKYVCVCVRVCVCVCVPRPAPHLHKTQSLVHVVDFVNSVGSLSESFEQFWSVTTLRTGA